MNKTREEYAAEAERLLEKAHRFDTGKRMETLTEALVLANLARLAKPGPNVLTVDTDGTAL